MADEVFKRKLAAILSADVVGYSLLMERDEEGTIHNLKTFRAAMTDLVQQYRGRVVDSPGDNILVEFPSVVEAVTCAVEIQRNFAEHNAELPEDSRMQFRIGVNLGDVVEDTGRIYGDGINIAARVESMAEAGGICITGRAYDHVANKLHLEYEFLGEHQVKNISTPIRVYRVLSYPGAAAHRVVQAKRARGQSSRKFAIAAGAAAVFVIAAVAGWYYSTQQPEPVEAALMENMKHPLPDKPSIAVLPFDNMSGDPEDEYIANGLTEDIITAIAKIESMFVIARNSTFAYKGKPVKVKEVSEEFGVQYVLEGSIQRSGDRLRVTAQLIDALTGHHMWADRYERKMKDLFDIKDEITKKIVTAMQVEITYGEEARLFAKQTDNLEAWLHASKGMTYIFDYSNEESVYIAREQFEQAIKVDPNFAGAWAGLGGTYMIEVTLGFSDNPKVSFKKFFEHSQKAVSLNESSPIAHELLREIYTRKGPLEKAIFEGQKAVALEPNNAFFHANLSKTMHVAGRSDEAIDLMKKAMRLSPIHQAWYLHWLGVYLHTAGRYEEAIHAYKQALEGQGMIGAVNPIWPNLGLTASYLELGQVDNAAEHYKAALALDPTRNFIAWAKVMTRYQGKDLERLKRRFKPLREMYAHKDIKTQYIHEGSPAFKFEYPEGSKTLPIAAPSEIVRMQAPRKYVFIASVADIPEGVKPEDFGPKAYLQDLQKRGVGSRFDVISNELKTLKDGTTAYKTVIRWLWNDGKTWYTSLIVSAYREEKYVCLATATAGDPEDVAWVVESLTFQ